jgi:CheY-like chemotaxis protein/anti-sigma regulatory factor (Ser/Thr protein kinase)
MNLCINAQHAMNNNGTILLTARHVQLDYEKKIYGQDLPAGNYVAIGVADTGKGIADKDLHHIFEPFYSTKPQGRGTGLGLALVYRIVRAHHGFIDVETQPGEGTTFTIYLTATATSGPVVAEPEQPVGGAGRGQRILLVDDDDMVLDATKRILERLSFRVDAFRSSLQALEAVKSNPRAWDLIFTDLSMPEMDGVRLVTQIRKVRPDVPVILYTGYLDAVESIDIDNLRILSKPSRVDDIASVVNDSLTNSNH